MTVQQLSKSSGVSIGYISDLKKLATALGVNMSIGENTKKYRLCRSLTQSELTAMIDKDVSTISKIETNSANPSLSTLYKISKVLAIPVTAILVVKAKARLKILNNRLRQKFAHSEYRLYCIML